MIILPIMKIRYNSLKKVSLSKAVAERIMRYISQGYLNVGDKLPPERELCEKFGVSRTSLREGIRSLVHMEILESIAGSGVYVRSASPEAVLKKKMKSFRINKRKIHKLIEFREGIESLIGELACKRATEADVRKLERLVNRMEKLKESGKSFSNEDVRFHREFSLSCHNEFVSMALEPVIPLIHSWVYAREELIDPEEALALHRRIVEKVKNRDVEGMRRAIKTHFDHTRKMMRRIEEENH